MVRIYYLEEFITSDTNSYRTHHPLRSKHRRAGQRVIMCVLICFLMLYVSLCVSLCVSLYASHQPLRSKHRRAGKPCRGCWGGFVCPYMCPYVCIPIEHINLCAQNTEEQAIDVDAG